MDGDDLILLYEIKDTKLGANVLFNEKDKFTISCDFQACNNPQSEVLMTVSNTMYFTIDATSTYLANNPVTNVQLPLFIQGVTATPKAAGVNATTAGHVLWLCSTKGSEHIMYPINRHGENTLVTSSQAGCNKKVNSEVSYYIGDGISQRNLFPYEYRPLFAANDMATMHIKVPVNYTAEIENMYTSAPNYLDIVPTQIISKIETANISPNTTSTPILPSGGVVAVTKSSSAIYSPPFTYSNFTAAINNMTLFPGTPPPAQLLGNNGNVLVIGDESFTQGVNYILHPSCASADPQTISAADMYYTIPAYATCTNGALTLGGSTNLTGSGSATLTTPGAVITLDANLDPRVEGNVLTYTVNSSVSGGVPGNAIVYFNQSDLPSGIELVEVKDNEGTVYSPIIDDYDSWRLYNLQNLDHGPYIFIFKATNCEALGQSAASVVFNYGWDCNDELPTAAQLPLTNSTSCA